jgi:aarF domain-containing kinase
LYSSRDLCDGLHNPDNADHIDNNMLPPEIEKVLQQVQANANYMPDWQMEQMMTSELGSDWSALFTSFDRTPIASASIGQVHRATLASTNLPVAVKLQFPGIASSINSDLSNLSLLLRSSALLPKGLYLENTIKVMKRELEDECDYLKEAEAARRFGEMLEADEYFVVPKVVTEASTDKVLTMEWMGGKPLSRMKGMSQETRNKVCLALLLAGSAYFTSLTLSSLVRCLIPCPTPRRLQERTPLTRQIGTNILRLCLLELFEFRFMQTDPNWANFLYASQTDQIQLIDFGASRQYSKEFMDGWWRLLGAAISGERDEMRKESLGLGYLTGEEEEVGAPSSNGD